MTIKVQVERLLGQGSQGSVLLVKHPETNKKHAIKKIPKKGNSFSNVGMEVAAGKRLKHKKIVELNNYWEDEHFHYLMFEYLTGCDLFTYLQNNTNGQGCGLPEELAKNIFIQLVKGLHHIHTSGFAHSDLKLENIMINPTNGKIKLIDFGLCHYAKEGEPTTIRGFSTEYASPEILSRLAIGRKTGSDAFQDWKTDLHKCDIFSLGIILYTMLFAEFPYDLETRNNSLCHIPIVISDDTAVSEDVKNLILAMTSSNPRDRPTIEEISRHPWLQRCPFNNS